MSLRGKKAADPRDQYWIDTVAAHGHAIVKVADAIDEPSDEPPFAYSLGVQESYGAPEFILFGLDGDIAAQVINNIVADLRSGRVLRCGVEERGFLNGEIPLFLLETSRDSARSFATFADWYYERESFPLWQVFWPAKNGCFPWDAGYPVELRADQPDLTGGNFEGRPR